MYKAIICGGSGYTGSELLRILYSHPDIEITSVTAERNVGSEITDLFPHLYPYKGLKFEPLDKETLFKKGDIFFMALPHSASQEAVDYFYKKGKKIVDLSADFRLKNLAAYEKWYEVKHHYPTTLKEAVYGLPELYRDEIKKTSLIACPGCYPTSAILGLYPALKNRIVSPTGIIIDSKSGTSGAGRKTDVSLSFSEVNSGFKAYKIASHRHTPEIEQELSLIAGVDLKVNFTPHLLPVPRGILSTIYAKVTKDVDIIEIYKNTYKDEQFVRVLDKGIFPDIRNVIGTNYCEIGIGINKETDTLIIVSVIDNLIKGASGQAIQNMNLMLDLPEITALNTIGILP
ncbi:MAG: N-acetyl-gamma-glutamyl-phosphate reductase [Nitrospirae bacterium]|nr:N-acetyl-gamma-glutamyl-phosphate reductase [Nitrospirota bacterium]